MVTGYLYRVYYVEKHSINLEFDGLLMMAING